MNVARFNFSHGDHEGHGKTLARLRKVASEKGRNIAVLLDTKGPEIRTGFFAGDDVDKIHLEKGQEIVLTSDYTYLGYVKPELTTHGRTVLAAFSAIELVRAAGSLRLPVFKTPSTCPSPTA